MRNMNTYICGDLDSLFKTFYSISAMVRDEGILTLENVIYTLEVVPVLFRIGVEIICDGNDKASTREVLENLMKASCFNAEETSAAEAMAEGLLSIQNGDAPSVTMAKMAKPLGVFKFSKYARMRGSVDYGKLTLFGQAFNLRASNAYPSAGMQNSVQEALEEAVEKRIVSFLNCNELARREGLIAVHEVVTKAPEAPAALCEILDWAVQTRDFNKLPEMVDDVLSRTADVSLTEAIMKEGVRSLFLGMGNRYMLSRLGAMFGVQGYDRVMDLLDNNRYGSTYYFGASYDMKKNRSEPCVQVETIVFQNRGETAEGYEALELSLAASAVSEVFEQYEGIEVIMSGPVPVELMASAIHILDAQYVNDVFRHHAGSDAFNGLKEAYAKDANGPEIHIRNANYLTDLMMGGDGSEYR